MKGNLEYAEPLYTDRSEGEISFFVTDPEMAYFMKGESVYRIIYGSSEAEFVGVLPGVLYIAPLSFNEILWFQDREDKMTDEGLSSFYINFHTSVSMAMDEFIKLNGEDHLNRIMLGSSYVDEKDTIFNRKPKFKISSHPNWADGYVNHLFPNGIPLTAGGITRTYSTSNSPGVYFTKNGGACRHSLATPAPGGCHGAGICQTNGSNCNCLKVNSAVQCLAFSYAVYEKLWGSFTSGTLRGQSGDFFNSYFNNNSVGIAMAIIYYKSLCVGANVRSMGGHSFILSAVNNHGLAIYEANYTDNDNDMCRVINRSLTWAQYVSNAKHAQVSQAYTQQHQFAYHSIGINGHLFCSRIGCDFVNDHFSNWGSRFCDSCGYMMW
jgi:hypothetical protein